MKIIKIYTIKNLIYENNQKFRLVKNYLKSHFKNLLS